MACFYGVFGSSCTATSAKSTLGTGTSGAPLSFTPTIGFSAPESGGTIDLGTFAVKSEALAGDAGTFDIVISFTAPAGSGGQTYSATTLGAVALGAGGAEITFSQPTSQLYTYNGGSFTVSLPSSTILIGAGSSAELDGTITPSVVPTPEPATAGVAGMALAVLALGVRRLRSR